MQKNIFEYTLPTGFDINALTQKLTEEIRSMDYEITVSEENGSIRFYLQKDIAPMELFLGRWQKLRATLTQKDGNLTLRFDKKNVADKIVCYIVGVFFFFIPYIFCFISNGNRKQIQKVFEKIVDDYVIKAKSNAAEQSDEG